MKIVLVLVTSLLVLGCGPSSAPSPAANVQSTVTVEPAGPKPNVIWILLDACRAQSLSCYGYGRQTSPNIDRLARRGVLFEQQFSQSARTSTSVPSYLSGRYFPVHCLGWRFCNVSVAREPSPGEMLFPAVMQANGYKTTMFTSSPLFRPADRLWKAFDEVAFWGQGKKCLLQRFEAVNEKLLPWLESRANRPQQPFFLYVHAMDTHFPHEMIPPYDQWINPAYSTDQLDVEGFGQRYGRKDGKPFTQEDKDYFRGLYDGAILDADTQIERLLEKLEELHLTDNTIVIIGADHGQILGEDGVTVAHGPSCDEDLHVPLIMAGPGIPKGKRISVLTENTDIAPTLADLLQLKTDATYDGVSLKAWIRTAASKPAHDYTFSKPWSIGDRYDFPGLFVLQTPEHKFEYLLQEKTAYLWQVPDTAANRVDTTAQHPKEAAALEKRMLDERMSLYKKFLSIPTEAVVVDAALVAANAKPADAIVDTFSLSQKGEPGELCADNKWALTEGRVWCRGAKETCPPLNVSIPAPDGRYAMRVGILNNSSFKGEPASAIRLKVGGDAESRLIVADDLPPEKACFQMIDLGEYEVKDGHIDVTIEQGDNLHWASLTAFLLLPVKPGEPVSPSTTKWFDPGTPESRTETEEMIKGLGYF